MVNHMDKVAEMLGLKLGETFKITKDNAEKQQYFRLTKEGVIVSVDGVYWTDSTTTIALEDILVGRAEVVALPWKPKMEEKYYVPNIFDWDYYKYYLWFNDKRDEEIYKRGLVFKTKEEAIEMSKKMLAMAKERGNLA